MLEERARNGKIIHGDCANPIVNFMHISPFNQTAEIWGHGEQWTMCRLNEIMILVGMHLRIPRWKLNLKLKDKAGDD